MASADFNSASDPLGDPWTTVTGGGNARATGGEAANSAGSDFDTAVYYSTSSSTESQVEYRSGTFDGSIGFFNSSGDGYVWTLYAGDTVEFYRLDAGFPNYNRVGPYATVTFAAGDIAKGKIDGNDLVFYKNGTEILRITETTYRTGLKPGMFLYAGNLRVDNWSDNVSSGSTVTMSGLATSAVYGTHVVTVTTENIAPTGKSSAAVYGTQTVTTGAQLVQPSGKSSVAAYGTHVVANVAAKVIQPSGLSSAAVFGTQMVHRELSSAGIPSAAVFGSLTVVGNHTVSPSGLTSAAVFGSHTLTQPSKTISPSGIGSAAVFGTHSIADVQLQVILTGLSSAAVFGSHTVATAGTQTIQPAGKSSAAVFGTQVLANVAAQAVQPAGKSSMAVYGAHTVGLVLENIQVPGLWRVEIFGRPTLIGGISTNFQYIGTHDVTIDDSVVLDREVGDDGIQIELGEV